MKPISALDIAHRMEALTFSWTTCEESWPFGIVVVPHDVNVAARFCYEILALLRES
jgi:ABC-type hemin transport system ATPase subunit